MIMQVLLSLVRGAFKNNQISDAASSSEHTYDPVAAHNAHINETHEKVRENAKLTTEPSKCVQADENSKSKYTSSEETPHFESDNQKKMQYPEYCNINQKQGIKTRA